jgi:hypothetical protein
VTFTATVSPVAPGAGSPTGTVQFKVDGTSLGIPVALVAGQASISTSSLSVGTRVITAEYSGDASFSGSTGTLTGGQKVLFLWEGFLQPINDTAHQTGVSESKFKAGQTIPAKFVLKNFAGQVVQQASNPTFTRSDRLGTCDITTAPEAELPLSPDSGAIYKWDGSQYHFNWSTKGLQAGEYRIYANLADGTKPYVDICLTK